MDTEPTDKDRALPWQLRDVVQGYMDPSYKRWIWEFLDPRRWNKTTTRKRDPGSNSSPHLGSQTTLPTDYSWDHQTSPPPTMANEVEEVVSSRPPEPTSLDRFASLWYVHRGVDEGNRGSLSPYHSGYLLYSVIIGVRLSSQGASRDKASRRCTPPRLFSVTRGTDTVCFPNTGTRKSSQFWVTKSKHKRRFMVFHTLPLTYHVSSLF